MEPVGHVYLGSFSQSQGRTLGSGNGTVVADAVMVVPSGTSADRVTYMPTLSSAGSLDIYAKWSASHTRAEAVTYRVHHVDGSTDIGVNQLQPSAGWFRLGAFSMTLGQNHRVEVAGALEGETVADAETGLNYNYFRDYDPTTGRYVQSDPIGLGGGLNTFAYIYGNPLRWSDPYGLFIPSHHAEASREAARK